MSTYLQLDCLYLKKQIYSETFFTLPYLLSMYSTSSGRGFLPLVTAAHEISPTCSCMHNPGEEECMIHIRGPQRSCDIFSQASVSHFVHGEGGALGRAPPRQTHLPGRQTSLGRQPQADNPLPSACWDTHSLPSSCWDRWYLLTAKLMGSRMKLVWIPRNRSKHL